MSYLRFNFIITFAVFSFVFGLGGHELSAQERWKLSLGGSYRDFGDIDFISFSFRNFGNESNAEGPFGILNLAATQPGLPDPSQVTVESVRFTGSSAEVDSSDSFAPVLGVETVFDLLAIENVEDTFYLSFIGNFQYFDVEVSESDVGLTGHSESFVVRQSTYDVLGGSIVLPRLDAGNDFSDGTRVVVENDFEMQLFIIDVGVKPAFSTERLSVGVAAGVTINVTEINTRQMERANFNSIPGAVDLNGRSVSGGYEITRKDENTDNILFGGYAAFNFEFGVTETIGVAFDYRYDWVDNTDAETSHARINLDGQSGSARLVYRF